MGMFSITRKKIAVVSTVAVLGLGGGIAYAYFSGTGTGTGSGAVGSISATTHDIHVIGTETTPLYPGGPSGSVGFTAWNVGTGYENLSTIHLSGVSADSGHPSCLTSDFTMPDVTVTDGDLAPGGVSPGTALGENGQLSLNNTSIPQDGCQGATLTLSFTTS